MKLKKIVASMLAIMTMAMGVAGMSANAEEDVASKDARYAVTVTQTFGSYGTATNYTDNTKVNASTSTSSSVSEIHVSITSVSGDTISGTKSVTKYNTSVPVSVNCTANNRSLTSATSYHYYKSGSAKSEKTIVH